MLLTTKISAIPASVKTHSPRLKRKGVTSKRTVRARSLCLTRAAKGYQAKDQVTGLRWWIATLKEALKRRRTGERFLRRKKLGIMLRTRPAAPVKRFPKCDRVYVRSSRKSDDLQHGFAENGEAVPEALSPKSDTKRCLEVCLINTKREKNMWLIRKTGEKTKAHIWTGEDTACRMASTGGLKMHKYELRQDRGNHAICSMCNSAEPSSGKFWDALAKVDKEESEKRLTAAIQAIIVNADAGMADQDANNPEKFARRVLAILKALDLLKV